MTITGMRDEEFLNLREMAEGDEGLLVSDFEDRIPAFVVECQRRDVVITIDDDGYLHMEDS